MFILRLGEVATEYRADLANFAFCVMGDQYHSRIAWIKVSKVFFLCLLPALEFDLAFTSLLFTSLHISRFEPFLQEDVYSQLLLSLLNVFIAVTYTIPCPRRFVIR